MSKYNPWFVAFIVACVFLIILFTVGIYELNTVNQKKYRIGFAIDNDNYCPSFNEGACELILDLNLDVPEVTDYTIYNQSLAYFIANNVACVEYPSINNEYDHLIPVPTNLTNLQTITYNDKIIGTVMTSNDIIWISYRGTRTKEEWEKDLMFDQVNSPLSMTVYNNPVVYSRNTNNQNNNEPIIYTSMSFIGMIHEGFIQLYTIIRAQLLNMINALSQPMIVIGGHSLGGALAILTNADTEAFPNKNSVAYVYGCPRVGNQTFINSLTKPIFSIQNDMDIIPQLPTPVSPNFTMSDNPKDVLLYANNTTNIITFNDQRGSLLNNHAMQTYLTFLKTP